MGLLNYTTKIDPEQTIGEIQKMLSKHGVTAMMTEYDGPNVSAVSFQMKINDKPMGFKMPRNWRAVLEIFKDDKNARKYGCVNDEQAIRTAMKKIIIQNHLSVGSFTENRTGLTTCFANWNSVDVFFFMFVGYFRMEFYKNH